jgi:hypothetical protein
MELPTVGKLYIIAADNWEGANMKCVHAGRTSMFESSE